MENIYLRIHRYLEEGRRTVLARIIRQVGSAPRAVGTGCLVTEDGGLTGTVGGGRLEFDVLARAQAIFKEGRSAIVSFKMTGKEVAATEMLCGGSVDVYLEPISPENKVARKVFAHLATIVNQGQAGVLVSRISAGIDRNDLTCRMLIGPDGKRVGDLVKRPIDRKKEWSHLGDTRHAALIESENDGISLFVEPVRPDDGLYLFGAGHISRHVAALADMVGFSVVVIDDRDQFANDERFPQADRVMVTPFDAAFNQININRSSYVVIVTRGHAHDRDVLKRALDHPAAYIGMIGSRRKIKIIYESLMADGITKDRLDAVHSPIGLSIGAQTPEEIAVAIVAELIDVRAKHREARHMKKEKT